VPELDLEDVLSEMLASIQGKKTKAKLEEALTRKFSLADLKEAYANASEDERAEFRELLGGTPAEVSAESEPEAKPKPKPKLRSVPKPEKEPTVTRQGRKSGQAYDYDVDEDGQVTKLGFARVYSGPDEEDEVEVPPAPEPEEEDDAA
jgi:hypothetical protein